MLSLRSGAAMLHYREDLYNEYGLAVPVTIDEFVSNAQALTKDTTGDGVVDVVLGGTSIEGGEGSIFGMLIGAFIVGFIANGLNLMGIHSFYQSIVKGVVLVGAVLLDQKLKGRIAD